MLKGKIFFADGIQRGGGIQPFPIGGGKRLWDRKTEQAVNLTGAGNSVMICRSLSPRGPGASG